MTTRCPACGADLELSLRGKSPARLGRAMSERLFSFDLLSSAFGASPAAGQVGAQIERSREAPAREPTLAGDVAVPLLQSLASGAVCALATSALAAYATGWPIGPAGAIGGGVGFAAVWFWRLADHSSLLRLVESEVVTPVGPEPIITDLPEREVIRLVPLAGRPEAPAAPAVQAPAGLLPYPVQAEPEPLLALPDGRRIARGKMSDMIIGANLVGLSLTAWRRRGYSRDEWETGRDLLALHQLATPRKEGVAGKLLVSSRAARAALGI